MSTQATASVIGLTARERIDVEPRRAVRSISTSRALVVGSLSVFLLGAVLLGHLQSTVTARDAKIRLLEQARFDLETRLGDVEYRLRVLWDDVRVAEEKARAGKNS